MIFLFRFAFMFMFVAATCDDYQRGEEKRSEVKTKTARVDINFKPSFAAHLMHNAFEVYM